MTPPIQFVAVPVLAAAVGLGVVFAFTQGEGEDPATTDPCPTPSASASPALAADPSAPPAVGDCEPWIAYSWSDGEQPGGPERIKVVRPDGTGAHVVVAAGDDHVRHVDWSNDGSRLAFDRQKDVIDDTGVHDIWTASADGSDAGLLIGCELPCLQLSNPSWSPDDTKLAVQRYDKDESVGLERCYIEVIDVATLERTVILEGPDGSDGTWDCYEFPRWSPDGSQVVFVATRWEQQSGDEWIRAGAPVGIVDTAGPPDQEPRWLTDAALDATFPDWHPTDDLIAFGTHHLQEHQTEWLATNLCTVRADGSDLQQVTDYGDGDVRATYPTWTPDGRQIIFQYVTPVTNVEYGGRGFAFINPDGTGLRVVPGVTGVEGRLRPIP